MSLESSYISRNYLLKSQCIFRKCLKIFKYISGNVSSYLPEEVSNFLCIYLVKPLVFLVISKYLVDV